MGSDAAELSSITTALAELTSRISRMADARSSDGEPDEVAAALFEVERNLQQAKRRLDRLGRTMRD